MQRRGHGLFSDITPEFACSERRKGGKLSVDKLFGYRAEFLILDISNTKQECIHYIQLLILYYITALQFEEPITRTTKIPAPLSWFILCDGSQNTMAH
jgi:hypothetical protein